MTLVEILFTLAFVTTVAAGTLDGISGLGNATRMEAARMNLVMALGQARRLSYLREQTVFAAATPGGSEVTIEAGGDVLRIPLRGGITIVEAPARGGVHFAASGWAENATFVVGWPGSDPADGANVIVNQRGRIR